MSLADENFAFGELKMLNFRPFFSLNLYVHEFWGLHAPLPKKNAFGELQMLNFTFLFFFLDLN